MLSLLLAAISLFQSGLLPLSFLGSRRGTYGGWPSHNKELEALPWERNKKALRVNGTSYLLPQYSEHKSINISYFVLLFFPLFHSPVHFSHLLYILLELNFEEHKLDINSAVKLNLKRFFSPTSGLL